MNYDGAMSRTHGDRTEARARRGAEAAEPAQLQEELAREAWAPLFELIQDRMRHFPLLAAEFELSPVQAHVLRTLGYGPQPMSMLADYLSCDASNVTGLVDRLETRGLVERRNAEHDRRVKMLCLTAAGAEVRRRLMERLSEPPVAIAALSAEDLRVLRDVMLRAVDKLKEQSQEGRGVFGPPPLRGEKTGP
ncbi:Transcriptional regulator, MarR family protein [Hyalangium minutum]|uniref:Transcriptional regulator, MarR family protein n=2 Tax=Hyalangium minutum TaxID=394096 RepID=A0A085WMY1_9BACT|nr:Transcriptional regulator, MarR family protein [Hyalangium minutum]